MQVNHIPGYVVSFFIAIGLCITMIVKTYQVEGTLNLIYVIYFLWIVGFGVGILLILMYPYLTKRLGTVEDF